MIQRKQTLFMLLLASVAILMITLDMNLLSGKLKTGSEEAYKFEVNVRKSIVLTEPVTDISGTSISYALIISALISLVSIFLFKNLPLQLRLTAFNFLFIALAIFYIVYKAYQMNSTDGITVSDFKVKAAAAMPLLMIIFNFLALRGIRKDIELLASADRLR